MNETISLQKKENRTSIEQKTKILKSEKKVRLFTACFTAFYFEYANKELKRIFLNGNPKDAFYNPQTNSNILSIVASMLKTDEMIIEPILLDESTKLYEVICKRIIKIDEILKN